MVFEERGKQSTWKKPLGAKEGTNNKLNPQVMSTQGSEICATFTSMPYISSDMTETDKQNGQHCAVTNFCLPQPLFWKLLTLDIHVEYH